MEKGLDLHKKLAMGKSGAKMPKMASGGGLKKGIPTSPITDVKRGNGVPGMKKGGSKKC